MSTDPGDAERVDVHLPEGIDVAPLEPFEQLGILDGTDHEPVTHQHPLHSDPAHLDPTTPKYRVDP
jgi:hypothetical protein